MPPAWRTTSATRRSATTASRPWPRWRTPAALLACGGFEGNAQSLRLLTRLEPKVPGAGLNLTRATLDAALKYPWLPEPPRPRPRTRPATGHPARAGQVRRLRVRRGRVRRGSGRGRPRAPPLPGGPGHGLGRRRGLLRPRRGGRPARRAHLAEEPDRSSPSGRRSAAVALAHYCPPAWGVTAAELESVFAEFIRLDCWQFSFDGGPAALAAAKNLTSELVGRLCQAAEDGTRAAAGAAPLSRYDADLVVPRRQLLECALLKAVAAHYVMSRPRAVAEQARERDLITELALAVERGAPATLDPVFQPAWDGAPSDQERHRVIIDQLASLTDTSALAWHERLALRPRARLRVRLPGLRRTAPGVPAPGADSGAGSARSTALTRGA